MNALTAWQRDTRYESSLMRIVLHPGYQAIIGMGVDAIPFILDDLRLQGGHWFWALHAITQADPTQQGGDLEAARLAWLNWGETHGYARPPAQSRPGSPLP
jgi:hypothetical protein